MSYFLFFIATILAGTINALAGGGGLITFPLLMLIVAPVTADATSAVALFFAYPTAVWRTRDQLDGVSGSRMVMAASDSERPRRFDRSSAAESDWQSQLYQFVPWLVLVATVIIVLRPILVRRDESGSVHPDITLALWPVAIAGIFLVALYGGYFGSGIGILMIGALSFISRGDIRHVVALKNFLTLCMRGVAVLVLVLEGNVNWNYGAPMAIGGLIGGYIGGMVSHRANRTVVRSIVIAIGFAASAYYFWKLYGPDRGSGRRRIETTEQIRSKGSIVLAFSARGTRRDIRSELLLNLGRGPELCESAWPTSVGNTFPSGVRHALAQRSIGHERSNRAREVFDVMRPRDQTVCLVRH